MKNKSADELLTEFVKDYKNHDNDKFKKLLDNIAGIDQSNEKIMNSLIKDKDDMDEIMDILGIDLGFKHNDQEPGYELVKKYINILEKVYKEKSPDITQKIKEALNS